MLFGGLSLCQSCFRGWKLLVAMEKMVVRLGGPQENLRTAKRSTEKTHFHEMPIPTDPSDDPDLSRNKQLSPCNMVESV